MRIVVSTHSGNLYDDIVDYVVVHSQADGEFAVMTDHVPIVSVLDEGYIKLVKDKDEFFVSVVSGIFEFNNNEAVVLVQEAHIGRSAESAKAHLDKVRAERVERNKQESVDFSQKEKELHENLKKAQAGHL